MINEEFLKKWFSDNNMIRGYDASSENEISISDPDYYYKIFVNFENDWNLELSYIKVLISSNLSEVYVEEITIEDGGFPDQEYNNRKASTKTILSFNEYNPNLKVIINVLNTVLEFRKINYKFIV